jgi:hypothetical protein
VNEFDLTVRRNALLMWLLAISGVPFIIYGVDVLFQRRLAITLTDYIYPSDRVTAPPFETHELAWAWVLLVVGGALTIWALKELIAPRRVLHADHRGLALAIAGPFAAPVRLPWSAIEAVEAGRVIDAGGDFDALQMYLAEPERVPENPWGARWTDAHTLTLAASEWDVDASIVADRLLTMAEAHREAIASEQVHAPAATWIEDETAEADASADGPWIRGDSEPAPSLTDGVAAAGLDTDLASADHDHDHDHAHQPQHDHEHDER